MRLRLLLLAACALVLGALPATAHAARGACVAGVSGPGCTVWYGKVTSVNDGDTLEVDVERDGSRRSKRVRITGIQAMEQTVYSARRRAGECHAVDATLRLDALVRAGRRRVRLAAEDAGSRSRHRWLRTVAVKLGGRWRDVGSIMLAEGHALWWGTWSESAPNRRYSVIAQRAASRQLRVYDPDSCGVGPSPLSPLKVWANWDADGNDTSNPDGEWVKVRNLDPVAPVDLSGWFVRDSALRRFVFPPGVVVAPGATVTVNVGIDGDGVTLFAWNLTRPVFENATADDQGMGDGAYLFDPLANLRAVMIYPCRYACADPLGGAIAISAQPVGRESVTLTNVSAGAVDLDGHVLKSAPYSYHFAPGTVLQPGASLVVRTRGAPEDDEPLLKHWGNANTILNDGGDVVRLASYTDVTIACAAWGDRGC